MKIIQEEISLRPDNKRITFKRERKKLKVFTAF